ncbi:MAG: hypothetical protein LW602_04380 [Sediminibacterium sp.]|jgi:hypothetical protein|nr:hypothetical protein [Sediminibacterium sp.]
MELSLLTLETYSKEKLIDYLNEFINHDFSKVVQLLYRIDVSEAKLKKVLQENPNEDAAGLIADLIIERIAIAKKARASFSRDNNNASNDEHNHQINTDDEGAERL